MELRGALVWTGASRRECSRGSIGGCHADGALHLEYCLRVARCSFLELPCLHGRGKWKKNGIVELIFSDTITVVWHWSFAISVLFHDVRFTRLVSCKRRRLSPFRKEKGSIIMCSWSRNVASLSIIAAIKMYSCKITQQGWGLEVMKGRTWVVKTLSRLKHVAVLPASWKEAIYNTVLVFVLLALYAAWMKNRLLKKNIENKTHVVEIWLRQPKEIAGVVNGCSFPKVAQLLPLGREILRPGTWAFFLFFFLFFIFNVLGLKMHTYFLTITWQALRGGEPQPPRRDLSSPLSRLAISQPVAPSGSGSQLGPCYFPPPSGGKTGWRNSYIKKV